MVKRKKLIYYFITLIIILFNVQSCKVFLPNKTPHITLTYISPKGFSKEVVFVKIVIVIDDEFPSDTMIMGYPNNVVNATISLVNNSGEMLKGFDNLYIRVFKIHTNNLGEIDAWSFQGSKESSINDKELNWAIYSYSTENFIIPGFTGRYPGHDQATITSVLTQDNHMNFAGHRIYKKVPLEGWKKNKQLEIDKNKKH